MIIVRQSEYLKFILIFRYYKSRTHFFDIIFFKLTQNFNIIYILHNIYFT